MREIEIKARLADKQSVLDALKAKGVELTHEITQHDRVYGMPGVPGASANHEPWLRIREETEEGSTTNFFTLKKSVTNQLDSIEHELMVGDTSELEKIILELGFTPYSEITKVRQKAHMDIIEICIDTVPTLGDFIEAEMLTGDEADYGAVIAQLWKALESLGINKSQEVTDGYDVLVNKQLGKE